MFQLLRKTSVCDNVRGALKMGIFLLFLLVSAQVVNSDNIGTDNGKNITDLARLRLQVFTNYDKEIQPSYYNDQGTNVTLSMTLKYADIDELNGKITLHGYLIILWTDAERQWNPVEYNGLENLSLPASEVWLPDIELFNGAGQEKFFLSNKRVDLSYRGSFVWTPEVIFTVYCKLNFRHWPYDTQTCEIQLGSWNLRYTYDAKSSQKHLQYQDFSSAEWEVIDASEDYKERGYNYMNFTVKLKRRSSMYTAIIYTPASCIILLALAVFWLPPRMGEKILLNGIAIVVISAFLMYFAQLLPILADNTPLIVLFYSSSLLLLSISTIVAVIVLYLSTAKHKRRVPSFLRKLLNGPLGQVLLLSDFTFESEPTLEANNLTKELGENVYSSADTESVYNSPNTNMTSPLSINPEEEPTNRSIQYDWVVLATAIDRVCFLCYCLTFTALAINYSV